MAYANLDLFAFDYRLDGGVERFRVRVEDSPRGNQAAIETTSLGPEVRELLARLERRELALADMAELGKRLADGLFPPQAREFLQDSRKQLAFDARLRIRLKFNHFALTNVPWEFMYLPAPEELAGGAEPPLDQTHFLALDPRLSIVRYELLTQAKLTIKPTPPGVLRVAAVFSNVRSAEYPLLDLNGERDRLEAAAKAANLAIEFQPPGKDDPATIDDLERALENTGGALRATHLFHFAGHGTFEKEMGETFGTVEGRGSVILTDDDGGVLAFPGAKLGRNLANYGVRLAVLGACETGRRDSINAWTGVAPALVRADIPAVVGMQYKLRDTNGLAFGKRFYKAIADRLSVDEAMTLARLAINNRSGEDERDWGVPVLYLRSDTGDLFPKPAPLQRDQLQPLFEDRLRVFGGRADALAQLHEFASSADGGYLTVIGPPDIGKTSLLARFLTDQPDAAYHFFSPSLDNEDMATSLDRRFFLKSMIEQLRRLRRVEGAPLPADDGDLLLEYRQLLDKDAPLPARSLLVLDGIDKVSEWSVKPLLPQPQALPDGLRVIASLRDTGQDWSQQFGLPRDPERVLAVGPMTRDDVADVRVRRRDEQITPFADFPALLDKVMEVAAFNPDSRSSAYPHYVRLIAESMTAATGPVNLAAIEVDIKGVMDRYHEQYFDEIDRSIDDPQASAKTQDALRALFSTLAVTKGRINQTDLQRLKPELKDNFKKGFFDQVVERTRRLVVGDATSGFELSVPRLRQYLQEKYSTEDTENSLLADCANWKANGSAYALRAFVRHLRDKGDTARILETVLDPDFRAAQRVVLRETARTLEDLQLALNLALDANDWPHVLACAGAHHEAQRGAGVARDIFAELTGGQPGRFDAALERAGFFDGIAGWAHALRLYIAWEAAEQGDIGAARRAVASARALDPAAVSLLRQALLVRVAQTLAARTLRGVGAWLAAFDAELDSGAVSARFALAGPRAAPDTADVAQRVERDLARMLQDAEGFAEMPTSAGMEEEETLRLVAMREPLQSIIAEREGKSLLDQALSFTLRNPYVQYRDEALATLAAAIPPAPDPVFVRTQLQRVLIAALDREGVTFTFDLASVLCTEALKRGLAAPRALADALDRARQTRDRWGTAMLAGSAQAAGQFRAGDPAAFATLTQSSAQMLGFAGFASVATLMLADRCVEFGRRADATQPVWGPLANDDLLGAAARLAQSVHQLGFREDRVELVAEYARRFNGPVPDTQGGLDLLKGTPDPDTQLALARWLSAAWSDPVVPNVDGLKALLRDRRFALRDATTLDAVLARLIGQHLGSLTDAQLEHALRTCESQLLTGKPWEFGTWR